MSAPAGFDREAVQMGDTITWQPPGPQPVRAGTVEYTVDEAVYVLTGSGSFAMRHRVPWPAVLTHTPRDRGNDPAC